MAKILRNGVEVKGTDPCPLITIKGKPFCLDRTCYVRKSSPACSPKAPDNAVPDFLVRMTVPEFQKNLKDGLWDSVVVEEN